MKRRSFKVSAKCISNAGAEHALTVGKTYPALDVTSAGSSKLVTLLDDQGDKRTLNAERFEVRIG